MDKIVCVMKACGRSASLTPNNSLQRTFESVSPKPTFKTKSPTDTEWLLRADSDVWLLPAISSATVRIADAEFGPRIEVNGLFC